MTALAFVLAVGAVVLPVGWAISMLSAGLAPFVSRLSPERRADLAAWITLLPAAAVLSLAVAIALPSVSFALGIGQDHCFAHGHHLHLCWFHAAPIPAWLAALAAAGWAVTLFRVLAAAAHVVQVQWIAASLAAMGERDGDVTWVPGTRAVCHATGFGRILVGRTLLSLPADELRAALSHERAHIARRDPVWSGVLAVASGFSFPGVGSAWTRAWRQAAEEAADGAAAQAVGAATVARSLVRVSRLDLAWAPGLGFGPIGLEPRVRRLLDGPPAPGASLAAWGALLLGLAVALSVGLGHQPLHHAAEEVWQVVIAG